MGRAPSPRRDAGNGPVVPAAAAMAAIAREPSEHGDHEWKPWRLPWQPQWSHPRGPRPSGVPERTYAPRDAENAAPVAPKRTERVDDFADFSFGKIEL